MQKVEQTVILKVVQKAEPIAVVLIRPVLKRTEADR
jgi:hypothetical protein